MTVVVRSYSFSPLAEAYGYVGQTAEDLRARAEALAVAHTTGYSQARSLAMPGADGHP